MLWRGVTVNHMTMKQNCDIVMCGSPCLLWCGVVACTNATTHAQWDVEGGQKGGRRTQVLVRLSGMSAAAAGSMPEVDAAPPATLGTLGLNLAGATFMSCMSQLSFSICTLLYTQVNQQLSARLESRHPDHHDDTTDSG